MKENTMKNTKNIKRTETLGTTEEAPKPAAVVTAKRIVRHQLTPEEREEKQGALLGALEARVNLEAEFSRAKQNYKAMIESAECSVTTLSSNLRAGEEMREEELEVVFRVDDGEKDFYLMGGG